MLHECVENQKCQRKKHEKKFRVHLKKKHEPIKTRLNTGSRDHTMHDPSNPSNKSHRLTPQTCL